jgi:hypothetical protein
LLLLPGVPQHLLPVLAPHLLSGQPQVPPSSCYFSHEDPPTTTSRDASFSCQRGAASHSDLSWGVPEHPLLSGCLTRLLGSHWCCSLLVNSSRGAPAFSATGDASRAFWATIGAVILFLFLLVVPQYSPPSGMSWPPLKQTQGSPDLPNLPRGMSQLSMLRETLCLPSGQPQVPESYSNF